MNQLNQKKCNKAGVSKAGMLKLQELIEAKTGMPGAAHQ
jgi:hypothetical protein